jgi:pimeloyl-ACP methyl ester carboxylesterase
MRGSRRQPFRTFATAFAFAALLLSMPARAGSSGSGAESPDDDDRMIEAFRERRPERLHIVNARDMIDDSGGRIAGAAPGDWSLDFSGGKGALPEERDDSLVIIFVHGYNTPLGDAMRDADGLRANLMTALPPALHPAFSLYAFLWRGNFGEISFGTAQAAADATAPSLAILIERLAQPRRKVVVIAHSLGARVALESLFDLPPRDPPWIDSLVLVQAAVPATDLLKWTAVNELSETEAIVHCAGRYADAIHNARQVVYTHSTRDDTLLRWFTMKEDWAPTHDKCFLPLFGADGQAGAIALGSPFASTALELLPPPRLPLQPRRQSGLMIDPFREPLRKDPGEIAIEFPAALYKYEFRWDHPDHEEVDLDALPGDFSSIANWHSPIFGDNGALIARALWSHVAVALRGR